MIADLKFNFYTNLMALILDGKIARDSIAEKLKNTFLGLGVPPQLAIIQIGNRDDSNAYIAQKKKFAEVIGAKVEHITFDESVRKEDVVRRIEELNNNASVHGIIIQLPIPQHLDEYELVEKVSPQKDVDGLTSTNLKLLWSNKQGGFVPATARGIVSLLDYYKLPLAGKRITIVGRSILVGKPAVLMMLNRDATVTVCHSGTCNLEEDTRHADILIVAIGKPKFIGKEHVSSKQIIIDVGINLVSGQSLEEEIEGTQLVGDVDFDAIKDVVSAISPVPGGVGPMTVASLFENVAEAYTMQINS